MTENQAFNIGMALRLFHPGATDLEIREVVLKIRAILEEV